MNELPQPAPPTPSSTAYSQQNAVAQPISPQAVDDKILQERATEQIESVVLQTATNPVERADNIHAIKEAYLKARFGIDLKEKAQ
ncbi:hypothetical protein IPL85_03050 [Candidatus Saccharibacteria bacterium]|nr:MAG: hypothetical protein IPL85_03050 [Candidatus Saccharibacteria bacterium]